MYNALILYKHFLRNICVVDGAINMKPDQDNLQLNNKLRRFILNKQNCILNKILQNRALRIMYLCCV